MVLMESYSNDGSENTSLTPSPKDPTGTILEFTRRRPLPEPPGMSVQQINPNFAPINPPSFSFISSPKNNYQPYQTPFHRENTPRSNAKLPRKGAEGAIGGMETIQKLLSTTIMPQNHAAPYQQQQMCTLPTPRTYSFDDTDENGILHVAIDANQRAKDVMDSCNSCETLGDIMSKVVHGQCVELFRITCDEGRNGERQIKGLEFDFRRSENNNICEWIKESQAARLKLLEARMRGVERITPDPEQQVLLQEKDLEEEPGSIALLKGIKSIADKYEDQSGEKRRRLGPDDEVFIIKADAGDGEKATPKDMEKIDAKSNATSPATKTVPLIQPRSRSSKQTSSIQMMPQPKKPKKKKSNKKTKEDNGAVDLTGMLSPLSSIVTIYDAPSEGELSLRNPQTAWAQRRGDELTITQRSETPSSNSQSYFTANSELPPKLYEGRVDEEREKYRNIYSTQQPHERPRANFFVLYSTEDEKPSSHHRTDLFGLSKNPNIAPTRMVGSIKPLDLDDTLEGRNGPDTAQGLEAGKEKETTLNQPNFVRSHEDMDNEVATAMEALKLEEKTTGDRDLEATLEVLRRDQEKVSAEISRLLEAQERNKREGREVDRLIEQNNSPPVKYKITQPGQQFALSEALDELIEPRAQVAPSFKLDSSQPEGYGKIASTSLFIPSDGCREPTREQKQEWLDSLTMSSTPTLSTESEGDTNENLFQMDATYLEDSQTLSPSPTDKTKTLLLHTESNATDQKPAAKPSWIPDTTILRYPPGFEPKGVSCGMTDSPPKPLAHPGPTTDEYMTKHLFERLGDEFGKLGHLKPKRSGKGKNPKPRAVKKEWTGDLNEGLKNQSPHPEPEETREFEGTATEIVGNDAVEHKPSTQDEAEDSLAQVPDLEGHPGTSARDSLVATQNDDEELASGPRDSGTEAKSSTKVEVFKIPRTEFTIESTLTLDTYSRKPKGLQTAELIDTSSKPLKSILKKTPQISKLTGPKAEIAESLRRERRRGERYTIVTGFVNKEKSSYGEVPFFDKPKTKMRLPEGVPTGNGLPIEQKKGPSKPPSRDFILAQKRYIMALRNLSKLPGFVREGESPFGDVDIELEDLDGSDSETEEKKAVRRILKGKAVDRDGWSGLDYRFYEFPPTVKDLPLSPPSSPEIKTPGEDNPEFVWAIEESLREAEREFEIEMQRELEAEATAVELDLPKDIPRAELSGRYKENPKETTETAQVTIGQPKPTQDVSRLDSSSTKPLKLSQKPPRPRRRSSSGPKSDNEDSDPLISVTEQARKKTEKAKL
ncbi:hypothetical protein TWF730_007027 [Orbilia blumenaviensis]|uniref:Uncharacterized protein n=1 Tax=Orbilia blumenaviensis TaxID=1796055 RepID=A0AAV9VG20_9PEZI